MQSVNSIVNDAFNKYDKNNDGVIELNSFNSFQDESSRDVRTVSNGYNQDIVTVTRFSNNQLFRGADRNFDGKVSRYELQNYVSSYDRDNDGYLDDYSSPWDNEESESEKFQNQNPETSYIVSSNVISHYPPYHPVHPLPPHHYDPYPFDPHHGDDHHFDPSPFDPHHGDDHHGDDHHFDPAPFDPHHGDDHHGDDHHFNPAPIDPHHGDDHHGDDHHNDQHHH